MCGIGPEDDECRGDEFDRNGIAGSNLTLQTGSASVDGKCAQKGKKHCGRGGSSF